MSARTEGPSFNAGSFVPKKYVKYTVAYSTVGPNSLATYSYFGPNTALLATVEIEYDPTGRDIRGELIG